MDDFKDLAFTKFSVGQSVSRFEDPELLKGEGTYTDDVKSESDTFQAFAFRSPYAHAKILEINITDAINQPGVLDIITHKDMDDSNI